VKSLIDVATGVLLYCIIDQLLSFWRNTKKSQLREGAAKVLEAHGMSAYLYLASIGAKDTTLRNAIDRYAFTGYIILDRNGEVVGKLVPKVVKGPHLRLVVDNTR